MSDPTPPAVSEAMREAVARAIEPDYDAIAAWDWQDARPILEKVNRVLAGPIASEIARLTERTKAAEKALVSLTPDGSEYYSRDGDGFRVDVAACMRFITRAKASKHETLVSAIRARQAAEAETARLRAGIQAMIDGNYDHPRRHRPGQCRHGIYFYDECGSCTDEALAALLTSQERADV